MPTLITRGAMSVQALGVGATSGGGGTGAFGPDNYWFSVIAQNDRIDYTNLRFNGVNELCFYGIYTGGPVIGAFNENFVITFSNHTTYSSTQSYYRRSGENFYTNSASNIYFIGNKNDYGYDNTTHSNVTFGNTIAFVSQLNNLGSSTWEKRDTQINGLGQGTNYSSSFSTAAVDNLNNIFCIGDYSYLLQFFPVQIWAKGMIFAKYDSAGNLVYSSSYEAPSGQFYDFYKASNTYNGNYFYLVNDVIDDATRNFLASVISKIQTDGTIIWTKTLNIRSTTSIVSNNLGYFYATVYDNSNNYIVVADENLTILWQKSVPLFSVNLYAISIDKNNNVFCVGQKSGYYYIFKLNSSGSVIWQKNIIGMSVDNLICDDYGNVYLIGYGDINYSYFCVVKIPPSGAVSGSYSTGGETITFSDVSFTFSNSSLSFSNYTPYSSGVNTYPYNDAPSTSDLAPFSTTISETPI